MAVPKRKTSKSRRNNRRSHLSMNLKNSIVEDKTTGKYRLAHRVDTEDGFYKGRSIFTKKERKKEE